MAHVYADRVQETSTTTGTGTLTLAGAVTGYQSFSAIGDGNTCDYVIELVGGSEWEVGTGTYTASGTTLARTTVRASSNAGSAVNFSAGTKLVYVAPLADVVSPGQQTIWVPAGAMEPRETTAPATLNVIELGTTLIPLRTMDFATDADDHAVFSVLMPKSWNLGTLTAQFVWSHPTAITNFDVTWGIKAGAWANGDALTTSAYGTAVTVADTGGATNALYISPEVSLTVGGTPASEELVYFEVYRDVDGNGTPGDDDLAVDARLHGVKIHYATNTNRDD